jgi:dihydrofolate reductase
MDIILIAAIGKNNELGKENQLIWHIPEDLTFFKKMTMGKTIVMGRKTFESLPKMLPGRRHVILSQHGSNFPSEVTCYHSLEELLEREKESFVVIGGAQIYKLFLEYATKIYLTEIDAEEKNSDAYFPEFDEKNWKRNVLSEFQEPISYRHVEYVKKR